MASDSKTGTFNVTSSSNLGNHCTCCHICHTSMKTSKREFFHCVSCTSVLCIQCVENYIIGIVSDAELEQQVNDIKRNIDQWRCLKCDGKCPCKRCKNRAPSHSAVKRSFTDDFSYLPSSKFPKSSLSSSLSSSSAASALFSYSKKMTNNNYDTRRKAKGGKKTALSRSFDGNGTEPFSDPDSTSSSAEDDLDALKLSAKNFLGDNAEANLLCDLRTKWERCEFYREQMTNFLNLIQEQQIYVQQQIEKLTSRSSSPSSSSPSSPSVPSSMASITSHSTSVV